MIIRTPFIWLMWGIIIHDINIGYIMATHMVMLMARFLWQLHAAGHILVQGSAIPLSLRRGDESEGLLVL